MIFKIGKTISIQNTFQTEFTFNFREMRELIKLFSPDSILGDFQNYLQLGFLISSEFTI